VKALILSIASIIFYRRVGMSLSDMDQAFFDKRQIPGFDGPAGYEVDFLFEKVFQFVCQLDETNAYLPIEINKDVYVTLVVLVSPGIGSKYS
jgi:hypothetical protein